MIELIKILAVLAAMQQGPSMKPVHLIADQPLKAERLDGTETTCFETMGTCIEFAKKAYVDRLDPEKPVFVPAGGESELRCITPQIVKMVGNYFLPGIWTAAAPTGPDFTVNVSHPKAPGMSFYVDFKNGCASRFEVKVQQ